MKVDFRAQHYMVVDPTEKLDVLWSFIKTHLKSKAMIFLSSCNQVWCEDRIGTARLGREQQ